LASPGSANDFVAVYTETLQLNDRTIKNMQAYFEAYAGAKVEQFNINHMLGNITARGLIIHDVEDQDASVAYARDIHRGWKNSILTITEGQGHRLRSQDKVIQPVIDFLNGDE
jgi:pimeloyl-ACP methyl ester carboxylesterase